MVSEAAAALIFLFSVISVFLYLATAGVALGVAVRSRREAYRGAAWLLFGLWLAVFALNASELATEVLGAALVSKIGGRGPQWWLLAQLFVECLVVAGVGIALLQFGGPARGRTDPHVSA